MAPSRDVAIYVSEARDPLELALDGAERTLEPTTFQRAREALEAAREAGVPFGEAWPVALRAVRPVDRRTLEATTDAWRAAYEGEPPSRRDRAVSLLAAELL